MPTGLLVWLPLYDDEAQPEFCAFKGDSIDNFPMIVFRPGRSIS